MKCGVCLRRKGFAAHLDEDSIGYLCPRCHFDLVMLVRLLVTGARALRQVDRQIVGRIVKALLSLGSPLLFALLLVAGCPEAPVVRFSSTYQNATPAPWVSLGLSIEGLEPEGSTLLADKAAAAAATYRCGVPAPGDVYLLSREVKKEGHGADSWVKTNLEAGFYCLPPGAPSPFRPLSPSDGGGHA